MKISKLQNILKDLPQETELYICDADTKLILEVQNITKGEKGAYLFGTYELSTNDELESDFFNGTDVYEIEKEEFLQKTKKWYGEKEFEKRKNWKRFFIK